KLGSRVHLGNPARLEELRRLLPPSPDQCRRLLFDTDPWPHRVDRYSICAERPFNGVEENETIVALLETMERTRLQFHARCFLADYWQWARTVERVEQWKRRIPYKRRMRFARRMRVARRASIQLDAFRQGALDLFQQARGDIDAVPETVLIKTRVFRDQEGRYHAQHFWPQYVGNKRTQIARLNGVTVSVSQRAAWFTDRDGHTFAGYDVSSSQTQILAVLLDLADLEE